MTRFATDEQLCLLRAALLPEPEAARAAREWLDAHRYFCREAFRGLDPASRRLLPLVHANVKEGIDAEQRKQLRAVHHEYWAENQRLFRRLEAMLQKLHEAGIPTLVLKGAALAVLHYRDMAARPMSDFDILVPEEAGAALARRLAGEGWVPEWIPSDAPEIDYFYRFRHAVNLVHPQEGSFDLHWHAILEATYRGADRHFWDGSVPLLVKSTPTRALNPTDQLLHACVHGFPKNPMPSIRWITDAVTILRTSRIDWGRFHAVAADLRVTVPCAETLAFLAENFDAEVAESEIAKLANYPASPSERRFFLRMSDRGARRWWETLEDVWTDHKRSNRDRSLLRSLPCLPRHLQFEQELPSLAGLIPHVFVFVKRRFV